MDDKPEMACLVVGPIQGNCYLVKCNRAGDGVVIDPGDEAETISREIRRLGLHPEAILLTHGHIDHANAACDLRKSFRSRVVCHKLDAGLVRARDEEPFFGIVHKPCSVDQEVADGDVLTVGGREFKVLHTPGHTPGSVCYLMDNLLFSGDTLFQGSIGRTDLAGGSEEAMRSSLLERLAKLDDRMVVYPGHGPSTTIGDEKRYNPFLQPLW
ncbi:MAG TPA: MBL fold metallo-hydrolase [bacterium]|nr:MBL fold metallo-hydrolase [bacterium]